MLYFSVAMLLCFSKICLWHRLLVSTKFVYSSNTIRGDRKKRVKMWILSLYHHQRCCPRLNPFFGREKKTFLTLCSWKSQIRLFWKIVFCRRRRRCCCCCLWQSQRHSTISFLLNLSLSLSFVWCCCCCCVSPSHFPENVAPRLNFFCLV